MDKIFDLLNQKEKLIEEAYILKQQIIEEQAKKDALEYNIWFKTDFSKVKASNSDLRKQYVSNQMKDVIPVVANLENDLNHINKKIEFLTQEINVLNNMYSGCSCESEQS